MCALVNPALSHGDIQTDQQQRLCVAGLLYCNYGGGDSSAGCFCPEGSVRSPGTGRQIADHVPLRFFKWAYCASQRKSAATKYVNI